MTEQCQCGGCKRRPKTGGTASYSHGAIYTDADAGEIAEIRIISNGPNGDRRDLRRVLSVLEEAREHDQTAVCIRNNNDIFRRVRLGAISRLREPGCGLR